MRLRRGSMLLRSVQSSMRLRRGSMLLRSGSKFKVQCCFAAVQVVQKLLRSVQSSRFNAASQRSRFKEKPKGLTRCEAALPAALLPYTPKALHAPQVLYTRFSALNA